MTEVVVTGEGDREPVADEQRFDPTTVSPSRVNKLDECGVAFRMKYVERVPERRRGSHALFGSVVHGALEKWAVNRQQNLLDLMRQSWLHETTEAPVVRKFLAEYQKISAGVLRAERDAIEAYNADPRNIRAGKTCKAPRMTNHFKKSDAAKALFRLQAEWQERLSEESPWEFSERDPLPTFYDDSLIIAKRYERQYGHLPPALHTEFGFDVPWNGMRLIGYIDSIELLVSPEGEVQGIGVIDYKTYKREPAEFKDYRQLVMYDVAVRFLVGEGILVLPYSIEDYPLYVGIDYVRQAGVECDWQVLVPEGAEHSSGNSRAWWQIGPEDHALLKTDLADYHEVVTGGHFRPASKSTNPDFCDYGDLCCLRNVANRGGCAARVEVKQ